MLHLVPCLLLFGMTIQADEGPPILQPGSKVETVADECKFTEGPTVGPDGTLYFSDGPNLRIMKLSPEGKLSVHLKPSGRANGTMMDSQGRLHMCQSSGEGGKRRVVRIELDGTETVLADKFNGKPFIAPNDLCIDKQGRVYFTDPYYGPPAEKSQPSSGVYRIDAPGKVVRLLTNLERPNGILMTPDNRTLYVSDRGTQKLHRYKVSEAGNLTPDGIVYDFSPDRGIDGMCLDVNGNIYGAAGENKTTGLFVISPHGKLLLHKPMPQFSTNVTFGGPDRKTLFFTATTSVYKLRTVTPGVLLPKSEVADKGKLHLYLLIGQSNMAGRGKVTKADLTPDPRVFALNRNDVWLLGKDPLHFDKPIAGVGPGLAFGKAMAKADPSAVIGLIPCAAGGSPISVWKKGGYWPQTKSHPYDDMLRRVRIAQQRGELKGILWHQGESDSQAEASGKYARELADLISRIRKDLNAPDVPFLVGGMSDPFIARNPHAKIVDQTLRNVAKSTRNSAYVSAEGLKLKSDNVHFDADSARTLGTRYAEVLQAMTANKK